MEKTGNRDDYVEDIKEEYEDIRIDHYDSIRVSVARWSCVHHVGKTLLSLDAPLFCCMYRTDTISTCQMLDPESSA